MGFNIKTTQLLLEAKKLGLDFSNVATIGRQTLNGSIIEFEKLFIKYGYSKKEIGNIIARENRYSEGFLFSLGAETIETFDASNYEGASIIWDMNLPIQADVKSKYSLVVDSGSLEHIFNFPQAIKNCMEMVRDGGHMVGITPSNNFFGHGFYQFSPELFFRIFTPENGFVIEKMWLFFPESDSPVYEVSDPLKVKSRVSLCNSKETFIFYLAKKIETKPVFESSPQQSDYEHIVWKKEEKINPKRKNGMLKVPSFLVLIALTLLKKWKVLKSISTPIGTGKGAFFKRVNF